MSPKDDEYHYSLIYPSLRAHESLLNFRPGLVARLSVSFSLRSRFSRRFDEKGARAASLDPKASISSRRYVTCVRTHTHAHDCQTSGRHSRLTRDANVAQCASVMRSTQRRGAKYRVTVFALYPPTLYYQVLGPSRIIDCAASQQI